MAVPSELEHSYEENNKLWDELQKAKKEIEELKKENNKYKKSANTNSTNSNKPSSTDMYPISRNTSLKEKSTKKVGGQPGHKAHLSSISDKPSKVIKLTVQKAPSGAKPVYDNEEILYYITQEINTKFVSEIIETRYFIDKDAPQCDEKLSLKYKINCVSYSDAFKTKLLYLNSKGTIPLARLCTMINELSNGVISLQPSTVVNWQKLFKDKSQPTLDYLLDELLKAILVCVDETGAKINGKKAWTHVICTYETALFFCTDVRNGVKGGPIEHLTEYLGYLIHDHFKSYYTYLNKCQHAECNAHILRALNMSIEQEQNIGCGKLKLLFQKMLNEKKQLIENGIYEMSEEKIQEYENEYLRIIDEALRKYNDENPQKVRAKYQPKYVPLLKRLQKFKDQHLMFIKDFRVPFDNNAAERQIRSVKAKKKISGQSKSLETAKYFTAIQSINQTCVLRNMNTLKAIENIINGNNPFN